METKEDDGAQEEFPPSPYHVLQQISGEAVRVAGEALQSVYLGSPRLLRLGSLGSGVHRRSRSEVITSGHGPQRSLQRLKSQVQRALHLGNDSQEQPFFNPEILANQKRQWYQFHSKTLDDTKFEEPSSLFEHFIIAGIHPDADLKVVEDAYAKRKKRELQVEQSEMIDLKMMQGRAHTHATMESQILFKYPPGKSLPTRVKDLAAFCFPGGVKARVLERTPSLSELNELVYGQEHLSSDDSTFIFSLKVGDNATLYGVCLHVREFVQRQPAIFGASSPPSQSSRGCSRFLVSAPRCYCLLTRVPFFELHYEMLNSIIAQERLNRITQFVSEMTLADYVPSESKLSDPMNENADHPDQCSTAWMDSAIPIDSAIPLAAAAAGIISDDVLSSSSSRWDPNSPNSAASDGSHHSQARETDTDERKDLHCSDDDTSDASERHSPCLGRMDRSCDSVQMPDIEAYAFPGSRTMEQLGSAESLFSSVRSAGSDDEDDGIFSCSDADAGVEMIMEWARENGNNLLQIVCSYHAMPLPLRGCKIVFKPLEHLQAIEYWRPHVCNLGVSDNHLDLEMQNALSTAKVKMKLAAVEEAVALSVWTTATICRVLSLENVLTLVAGVLLEKQVVIVCPNLGVLSATVLSLIPMILPFEWQSLFLPVLPGKMLDFLDAPVPFIVGIQHKPADFRMKTSNLVQVNVAKDQVKMCSLPSLPRHQELISELGPLHAKMSCEKSAKRHPVYRCNKMQAEAATQFFTIMRRYMESLCSNLSSHTITSVQSDNDRIAILLKESFVDSFPNKDQPFIKLFVDTQLFMVLSDSQLSRHENGYH